MLPFSHKSTEAQEQEQEQEMITINFFYNLWYSSMPYHNEIVDVTSNKWRKMENK